MAIRKRKSEEETNYLVSTADLMAGLLFVFIIALALQIMLYNEEETKAREAEAQASAIQKKLAGNDIARSDLLERVQKRLAARNIDVSIDPTNGVLRLPEASITFETGKSTLKPEYVKRLESVRESLETELACFHKRADQEACREANPYGHTLDAVFIEGHTDNQPFGGDTTGHLNRRLSTDRANTVYSILLGEGSRLRQYRNPNNQNLFSLSGYGEERPVPGHFHASPTNDPVNRRIELRFLMSTPSLEVGEK